MKHVFDFNPKDITSKDFFKTILETISSTIDNDVKIKLQSKNIRYNLLNESADNFLFNNHFPIVNPDTKQLDSGLLHFSLLTCKMNDIPKLCKVAENLIRENGFTNDFMIHFDEMEDLMPLTTFLNIMDGFI